MKRLKTFLLYALAIAAFWFLSDFLIYMAINGSYSPIESKIVAESPDINVGESKATYVNGYVKGNIYNNTNATINNQYLKIDLYSPRDVLMGTKYVKIDSLEPGQTMDYEMWFKYTDVEYSIIDITNDSANITDQQLVSEETKYYLVVGSLFLLYFL